MIDLHVHLLPGLDDGPTTLREAEALLEELAREGVRVAVATPHFLPGAYTPRPERVLEGVQELQARAPADLRLLAGMEVFLEGPHVVDWLQEGRILPLGGPAGRAVLVELPLYQEAPWIDEALFALRAAGYRPVVAHPERSLWLHRQEARLGRWVEMGVVLQVNAGSLLGASGWRIRRFARRILQKGWVAVVASDRHGPGAGRSGLLPLRDHLVRLGVRPNLLLTEGPAELLPVPPA